MGVLMRLLLRSGFMLFAVWLLAGCAGIAPLDEREKNNVWNQNKLRLAQLDAWSFRGRLAVSDGRESSSVFMRWQQQPDAYVIHLMTFLGQQLARLEGNSNNVTLYRKDHPPMQASSVAALMAEQVGWTVPVDGLRYWIKGLSDSRSGFSSELDTQGRLAILRQSGWTVKFERYREIDGLPVPAKMRLERDDLNIRLVMDRWEFASKSEE